MSLEAILASIDTAGQAEVDRVRAESAARVAEILAETDWLTATRRRQAREIALRPAEGERARRLQLAKLEAVKIRGEACGRLVEEALEGTRQRLAKLAGSKDYPGVLRQLIEEVVRVLPECTSPGGGTSSSPTLQVRPEDAPVAQKVLADLGAVMRLDPTLPGWGGVIGRSSDDRVVATNTLEARLERALPFLQQSLATFFGAQCGDEVAPTRSAA